ncbi:hypothetical protein GE061_001670 [Apolygus lucorum]|uniref:RNase H type-1 domain-containing protein n=1 Tax=Apolygus lucorum TaxID=248454 RepID=A0A6A4JX94_APOLU|nr:hypothetical protein GE061_001670 [Apolygus lucorum]
MRPGTTIQWIPGHIDLVNHDKADTQAKMACEKCLLTATSKSIPIGDLESICKTKLMREWQVDYENISLGKGNFHFEIMPQVSSQQWFKTWKSSRRNITKLIRLRTGHGLLNKTLFLYKFAPSQLCDVCGVLEDVEHILIECEQYNEERSAFPRLLESSTSVSTMFKTLDRDLYRVILTFLEYIGRDI